MGVGFDPRRFINRMPVDAKSPGISNSGGGNLSGSAERLGYVERCDVFERINVISRRNLVKSIRRRVQQEFANFDAALHRCFRRNTRDYLYAFRAFNSISFRSVMCCLFFDRRPCQGRFWSDFNGNLDGNRPGSNWRSFAECDDLSQEH